MFCLPVFVAAQTPASAPALRVVADEAEAVLAILALRQQGKEPTEAQWRALFASEGYRRLKERERAMKRPFEDPSFQTFVQSADLLHGASALRETLGRWRSVDLQASARKVSAYLPEGASIRATVYFVIKPRTNSFVFDLDRDPAVFMYLDPAVAPAKLENTVAHELHHVGLHGILNRHSQWKGGSGAPVELARTYVGAFGEGFAMLAAAGGPDVHPHAVSPATERARWDRDMGRFAQDLQAVDAFLLEVASGRLGPEAAQEKAMATFWGEAQGAWYTVGYRMAVLIEKTFGRARLLACMEDLSLLLPAYNEAARIANSKSESPLPLWSGVLLSALAGIP
jgi:hypothetical protein